MTMTAKDYVMLARLLSEHMEAADSEERRLGRPSRIAAAAGKLLGG